MAMTLGTLRVDIEADVSDLRRSEAEVDQSSRRMSSSLKKIGVAAAAAGAAAVALAVNVIKTADNMRVLEVSIKRLVGTTEEAKKAMDALAETSAATGLELSQSAQIFQRFASAKVELGATNEQLLELTDTLAKMGALGGSSPEELRNALVQLSQGFAGGIIRAEEFNSIVEGAPEIIRQVGHSMGMSMGEVRKAMLEGELTADAMFDAILDSTQRVGDEFAKLPTSLEQGLNAVSVAWQQMIADIEGATAASEFLVGIMAKISEQMNDMRIEKEAEENLKAISDSYSALHENEQVQIKEVGKLYHELHKNAKFYKDTEKEFSEEKIASMMAEIRALATLSDATKKHYELMRSAGPIEGVDTSLAGEQPEEAIEKAPTGPTKAQQKRLDQITRFGETRRQELTRQFKKDADLIGTSLAHDREQRDEHFKKLHEAYKAGLDKIAEEEARAIEKETDAQEKEDAARAARLQSRQDADNRKIEQIRQLGETEREEIRRIAEEKHEFLMTQTQLDSEELAELQKKINDEAMAALAASADREQEQKKQQAEREKADLEQLEADKQRIREQGLARAGQLTSQFHDLMVAAGKEGSDIAKAIFLANKAVQVAQIITATHVAAANASAVAATGGPAAFFASEAAILAQGYASAGIVAGTAVANTFGGGRQFGGTVSPIMAHPVNEAGVPELLEMGSKQYLLPTGAGGTISPLSDSSTGSPNVTIISNGTPQTVDNVSMTRGEIAVMISDMGRRTERRINASLASGRGDTARSLQAGFKTDRNLR